MLLHQPDVQILQGKPPIIIHALHHPLSTKHQPAILFPLRCIIFNLSNNSLEATHFFNHMTWEAQSGGWGGAVYREQ